MEPKTPKPEFPRIVLRWTQNGQVYNPDFTMPSDEEMTRIMDEMLKALEEAIQDDNREDSDEMFNLGCLDTTVQGDEHPEALSWIMSAYRRIEDERRL